VRADALGRWAYHCHLLYHMEAGMMREVAWRRPHERRPAPARHRPAVLGTHRWPRKPEPRHVHPSMPQ
jgi:hypothetical protein